MYAKRTMGAGAAACLIVMAAYIIYTITAPQPPRPAENVPMENVVMGEADIYLFSKEGTVNFEYRVSVGIDNRYGMSLTISPTGTPSVAGIDGRLFEKLGENEENLVVIRAATNGTDYASVMGGMLDGIQSACFKRPLVMGLSIESVTRERPDYPFGSEYVRLRGTATLAFAISRDITISSNAGGNVVLVAAEWPETYSQPNRLTFAEDAQNLFSILAPRVVKYNMDRSIAEILPHGVELGNVGFSREFATSIDMMGDIPQYSTKLYIARNGGVGSFTIMNSDTPENLPVGVQFLTGIDKLPPSPDKGRPYGGWGIWGHFGGCMRDLEWYPYLDDVVDAIRSKDAGSLAIKRFVRELLSRRLAGTSEITNEVVGVPAGDILPPAEEVTIDEYGLEVDEEKEYLRFNYHAEIACEHQTAAPAVLSISIEKKEDEVLSYLKVGLPAEEYISPPRFDVGDTVTLSEKAVTLVNIFAGYGQGLRVVFTGGGIELELLKGEGRAVRDRIFFDTVPTELSVKINIHEDYAPAQSDIDAVGEPAEVVVFVDRLLYNTLESEIDEYKQHIVDMGYSTKVHVSGPSWEYVGALDLRNTIIAYRAAAEQRGTELRGAILVGFAPLPYISDEDCGPAYYSSNIYYMDLDDTFYDLDGDPFIEHMVGGSDIWVARMFPTGYTDAESILGRYMRKINAYHRGEVGVPGKAVVAAIGEFADRGEDMRGTLRGLWPSKQISALVDVTAEEYVSELETGAEICWLITHGSQYSELFINSSLDGDEAGGISRGALLYVLESCSNSDLFGAAHGGYIAGSYIYGGGDGMASLAYNRIGGSSEHSTLFGALSEGRPLGEAYLIWMKEYSVDLVMLNGDPFLTIS